MSETTKRERPLSPHLQIYKPQMTSVMSILHRATGLALVYGLIMVVWMLIAAATSMDAYNYFLNFCNSLIGQLMLFGWSFALYYHMCNGIRHLFWDMGFLFKIENAYKAGYVVLLFAFGLTAITWL
jgi:succinate dehydrogenase / fumarate reductase cytochrome b subunit